MNLSLSFRKLFLNDKNISENGNKYRIINRKNKLLLRP